MMKRITPENLPEILDENTIETLAHMANEIPQSKEWHQIFEMLSPQDLRKVMDMRLLIQDKDVEAKKASMSDKEKEEEKNKRKKMLKKIEEDPNTFYGNMGQPETPQDFKNRYGVWPPGYDDNGKKIK